MRRTDPTPPAPEDLTILMREAWAPARDRVVGAVVWANVAHAGALRVEAGRVVAYYGGGAALQIGLNERDLQDPMFSLTVARRDDGGMVRALRYLAEPVDAQRALDELLDVLAGGVWTP